MEMKKSFMLLMAFGGVIAFLVAPGIVAADGPISPWGGIPPADNTFTFSNTGGGYGGGVDPAYWGTPIELECHGAASPYFEDPNHLTPGGVYDGVVVLWQGATLPTLPSTLDALLSSPNGSQVNDLLVFSHATHSWVFIISEPSISLLPFETGSASGPNNPSPSDQQKDWNIISTMYAENAKVIFENANQIYTPYTPPNMNWPGWDPTVPDWTHYTVPDKWNSDYPAPSTWTQYTYYVENDNVQVPEPGVLLLLCFGLAGLGIYRRRLESI